VVKQIKNIVEHLWDCYKIATIFSNMLRATIIRLAYVVVLFFASLVISNLALPGKFGILSILILNASLFLILTGFGVDSIVLYKVSNNQWHISQAYHFVWKGILLQAVLFTFLEIAALLIFHRTLLSNATPDYFLVDAFYFIGLAVVDKYVALYYSQNKAALANSILFLVAVLYFLALLLFYYGVKVPWIDVLYLFGFQNIAQAIGLVVCFKVGGTTKASLKQQEAFTALKSSSIVMITNVIQLLAYRVDFWMISLFYGSYQVGIYAQANKFANFSWIVPNILSQILIPSFATMKKKESSDVFSTAFGLNFVIILFTLFLALFFYFFYLDPQYRAGLDAFYLMLPGYLFWASVVYFGSYFSSKGKFVYNLLGSCLCLVLILGADILLIPRYGIRGAALANTITYFSVFVGYVAVLTKKRSFNLNDLLMPRAKSFFNMYKLLTK
jgi:O-antigen/teichoic acid export membrane protein